MPIEKYGINAVHHSAASCPEQGCEQVHALTVLHNEGKVIRGPAPLSLALAHAEINETDTIIFP